jgi:predicted ATP-grasp superfamily ATP-dependent carboligase
MNNESMANPDGSPPCFVLGIETQIGVGVVRELGRAGVRVIGLANRSQSIGLRSRDLARGVVVGSTRDQNLIDRIRALGDEYGAGVLLAISETDLSWLIEHRDAFLPIKVVAPPADVFQRVLNKAETLALAERIGIHVPRTVNARSADEWRAACATVRYPVVVKWADPIAVMAHLRSHGLQLQKLEYAADESALVRIGERFAAAGVWPMIQEYCPGRGLGQFFFMHKGEAIRRFQHARIAEWPPEGGFSSVCDVVPLSRYPALQEQSVALLQAIGWEGCAMVEYRLDQGTDDAVLMEINGRFWGSFPLAVHAGAGFASLAYWIGSGQAPKALPPVNESLRCRMISTELKRLARILFQPKLIRDPFFRVRPAHEVWRFVSDFFRPDTRYYVWDRNDPGPFFADLKNYLLRVLKLRR